MALFVLHVAPQWRSPQKHSFGECEVLWTLFLRGFVLIPAAQRATVLKIKACGVPC